MLNGTIQGLGLPGTPGSYAGVNDSDGLCRWRQSLIKPGARYLLGGYSLAQAINLQTSFLQWVIMLNTPLRWAD